MSDSLLIELLTEELPPKRLKQLSESFSESVYRGLVDHQFTDEGVTFTPFASPRRLAVIIDNVRDKQPQQHIEKKGPNLKQALLADGTPSPALQGFMRSCAVEFDQLTVLKDNKGQDVYGVKLEEEGKELKDLLPDILNKAFSQLPVAKMMRWGESSFNFVRPVHGLVVLHGKSVIPVSLLGLQSSNVTLGHRFLSTQSITLTHATDYATQLKQQGFVVANFNERKQLIHDALQKNAGDLSVVGDDALLNEVTSLVEWPQVLKGQFDARFLDVPAECLILSMQQHQKYFPLKDTQGKLQPSFLLVSNIETSDPHLIVDGNERVLRARLSDAQFFYQTDLKTPLLHRQEQLKHVVYVKALGSVFERVDRIKTIVTQIAERIGAQVNVCQLAATLSKGDLTSDMVGEFPELQGIMGKYYALHDGHGQQVADAIEEHYHPRFANDTLPISREGLSLALAEKIEALIGLFACGQIPTGDKDPFGLRRASLGIIRLCIEGQLTLELDSLIRHASTAFSQVKVNEEIQEKVIQFIVERLKGYLKDQLYHHAEIEAILPFAHSRLDLIPKRLLAIREFSRLDESKSLAGAHKRIRNILKKNTLTVSSSMNFDKLVLPTELKLINALKEVSKNVHEAMGRSDFTQALNVLVALTEPINTFFNDVMIMAEDLELRNQRIALLHNISELMQQVADIGTLDA